MTPSDIEAQRKKEKRKVFSILRKKGGKRI